MQAFEDIGEGDPAIGMERMAAALAEIDYGKQRPTNVAPLLTDFVFPFYGGAAEYREAMRPKT